MKPGDPVWIDERRSWVYWVREVRPRTVVVSSSPTGRGAGDDTLTVKKRDVRLLTPAERDAYDAQRERYRRREAVWRAATELIRLARESDEGLDRACAVLGVE